MSQKVLCVDDEPNILEAYQRALRKEFRIETAASGAEGLAAVASRGPYAVVVSDMRMPGMDGVQFLAEVKKIAPDSVRMMLTGNADQQTAIDAVNEGYIFRFLNKPCPPEVLAKALRAGIEQHRLVRAEKELLEQTLSGSIQVLTDVLSLVNPTAFGRAARVRRLVLKLAAALKVENAWQIEIAALLSQLGCITVPEEILAKVYQGRALQVEELRMMQAHPQVGHDLIARIPRLEPVAQIIAYQEKRFNGSGLPDSGKRGEAIPLGARILKLALDFDKLIESRIGHSEAYREIERRGDWYDPFVVEALKPALAEEISYEARSVKVEELSSGMILAEDIVSVKGLLLIPSGQEVTGSLRLRLQNYVQGRMITGPIKALVPLTKSEGACAEVPKPHAGGQGT
jgi:response regulator RpfG family c-di-GMP phosphodiesterase